MNADRPSSPSLRYPWYVVFVLMLCYTLSFIDRTILSLLVGPMRRELQISDTQIGLLQGLAKGDKLVTLEFSGIGSGPAEKTRLLALAQEAVARVH